MRIKLHKQPETIQKYFIDIAKTAEPRTLPGRLVVVRRFNTWMEKNGYAVDTLTPDQFSEYDLLIFNTPMMPTSRNTVMQGARKYLSWHFKQGLCGFDPKALQVTLPQKPFEPIKIELPEIAEDYLAAMATHKKNSTCTSYRQTLRHLYNYLNTSQTDLLAFTRREMDHFHEYLHQRKLKPVLRAQHLVLCRGYLRWLFANGHSRIDPDETMRTLSLPRIPLALPRPLSPEYDQFFQDAFLASSDFIGRSFYVMRHTGMRLGELVSLPFDCVQIATDGTALLKVPLGKMDTERLVPIFPEVLAVIRELQQAARNHTKSDKTPAGLFIGPRGRRLKKASFNLGFTEIKRRLIMVGKIEETADAPINPHRLRHTYATSLLTGGMNIVVLQKLLGHRSIRMTLRYAEVVPIKITEDYFSALKVLEARQYLEAAGEVRPLSKLGHRKLIADLIFILRRSAAGAAPKKSYRIESLIGQVEQLSRDIAKL